MRLSVKNRPLEISHSYEHTFDNNTVKISLSKKSLLFPVFDEKENKQIGFLLEGPLSIIADLIVHSQVGAVGELIEETFSTAILFPVNLPFLSLDHVKESAPVEIFEPYQELVNKYNRVYSLSKMEIADFNKHTIIVTQKPRLFWIISPDSVFLLGKKEIIGRKGQNKLLWISKKGLISVSKKGTYKNIGDMFEIKRIKQTFQSAFEKPLTNLFSSIQNAFSKLI
ncbi:MAG: hypothetical protein KGD64_01190 [Candidatus Heimdallarchaeota archaeon]|nr:hypothetical protein [Candidatus Heimdallarchaeota archaeon]